MKDSVLLIAIFLLVLHGVAGGETPTDRIIMSLETGEISEAEAAQLLVLSVTDFYELPLRYSGGTDAESCGTLALLRALHLENGAGITVANRPSLSGPMYTLDSPGGHFKIHWTDSGSDSINYDYAFNIALAADTSWLVQCDQMGFFQPPPDNGVGGDDLYDIYIVCLSGGVLGYSSCSGEYHPPDSTHDCSASHIVVHSEISDTGQRDCVVAHEFQHAVQASYDYNEATWFLEYCAVWMTEMVFPEVDDYLGSITSGENALRTPWLDIRSYYYGGFPWPWMMWNRWGYQSVRNVWEYCASQSGNNTFEAHESMLADHGTTFEEFFMDYGAWRWFTADNWFDGCGMYSQEASTWLPGPRVLSWHEVTSLPFSGDQTENFPPDLYGIHWIRVDLSYYQDDWIQMSFNGRDYFEWNMGVIMQNMSGQLYFEWYDCDSTTGDIELHLEASGWDYFIFFPAFMDITSLNHLYEITIMPYYGIGGVPAVEDRLNIRVSTNPMFLGGSVTFDIPLAGHALLQVYDISGRVAVTMLDSDVQAGTHTVQLEAPDLSSGTYFIILFSGNSMSGSRVVIVR